MVASDLLVDTNVVLDLTVPDSSLAEWSQRQLEHCSLTHRLVINPVIYAELSVGFLHIEELERMLHATGLVVEPIPREGLFLAGKAFQRYRRARGVRTGVLPDFFIGAHAAVANLPLITRDKGRYRTYFPTVHLIAPPRGLVNPSKISS